LLAGCGVGLSAATFSAAGSTPREDAGGAALYGAADAAADTMTVAVAPVEDAAVTVQPSTSAGSPLCGMRAAGDASVACDPDDGTCTSYRISEDAGAPAADAEPLADAGGVGAMEDAAPTTLGCHVVTHKLEAGVASVAPSCTPAGTGTAESPCSASNDCAPGFECVLDESRLPSDGASVGPGVCRHYCCDNTCSGAHAFCDKETVVGGLAAVPVCVTRSPSPAVDGGVTCQLLEDSTCGGSFDCQVVNADTGQVACVAAGTATAGQSCELTNCAKGLSCVAGYFPDRSCAQLCDLDNNDCPSGQYCAANAALSSTNARVGVCTS
jgi:hypothetical protein